MDSVQFPISVLVSLGSGVLTIGAVYGIFKTKMAALQTAFDELREQQAATARDLNIAEKEHIKLEGRVMVLSSRDEERENTVNELKSTVVDRDVFITRMTEQDKALKDISQRLNAGARTLSQQMPTRGRVDTPTSDPPESGLPPMRPRLPSRR